MSDKPIRLTREQLYEIAWSEPLSSAAPRVGLTGTGLGLAKILDRLDTSKPRNQPREDSAAQTPPPRSHPNQAKAEQ